MNSLEIAYHQLRRAFTLFSCDKDYICALTLSGAADEVLGKLVSDTTGGKNALAVDVELIQAIMKAHGDEASIKDIRDRLVCPRNALKHLKFDPNVDLDFDFAFEAEYMIDRAVSNYLLLTKKWPDDPAYDDYLKFRKKLRNCTSQNF